MPHEVLRWLRAAAPRSARLQGSESSGEVPNRSPLRLGGLYLSSLGGVTLMTHAKFEVIAKLIWCTRDCAGVVIPTRLRLKCALSALAFGQVPKQKGSGVWDLFVVGPPNGALGFTYSTLRRVHVGLSFPFSCTPRPTDEKPNSEPSRPQVDFCLSLLVDLRR